MTITKKELNDYLKSIGGLKNGIVPKSIEITDSNNFSVGPGWYGIIKNLIEELILLSWDKELTQCKEKFGGLRFYINSGSEEIYKTISKYEKMSYKICEICGEEGERINKNGWISVRCKLHQ